MLLGKQETDTFYVTVIASRTENVRITKLLGHHEDRQGRSLARYFFAVVRSRSVAV